MDPRVISISLEALGLIAIIAALISCGAARNRRPVVICLVCGLVFVGAAIFFNTGQRIQESTGVNLHLPSTLQARAKQWLRDHENQQPDQKQVGRNRQIWADGMIFYRAYADSFPPDAKLQLEQFSAIPVKIDHILSFAEEQRYYAAAQKVCEVMHSLAADVPEKPTDKK